MQDDIIMSFPKEASTFGNFKEVMGEMSLLSMEDDGLFDTFARGTLRVSLFLLECVV